ncbi:DUF3298 domain-containing protein [Aliarcobacter butzleri]
MKMDYFIYNKKIRIIIAIIWVSLFTYFLYAWAKDDQTFEVAVAALALFASNIFSIIIPPKKDTFKIEVINNIFKSDTLLKHGLNLEFPKIIYKDNTPIEKKINLLIARIYLRHGINIKNKEILEDSLGEVNSKYEITYKSENLLCIKFTNFIYYDGAAHGNVEIVTLNINLFTGEEFEFKDIFRSDGVEEIKNIVKTKLLSHKCKDVYFDFDSIELRNNHNFYLNDDNNLIIVFFKYEIAPGACGPIEIEINMNELKRYLNPNGPFSIMFNKYLDSSNILKGHTFEFTYNAYMKANAKFNQNN